LTGKIEKWQHQQLKVVTPSVFLGNFDNGGEGGIQITVKKAHFQALSEHRATRLPITANSFLRLPVSGNLATANRVDSAISILAAEGQIRRI
jgi:hypothetical protein